MAIGNPVSLTGNISSKTISVTATAGQTLFTVTGGYRVNQISVFRNGSRLVDSLDYTARDGATVTLLSPATLGDSIEFQVFDTFRVADAINANDPNVNFLGNVSIGSSITLYSSTGIVTAAKYYGDGSALTGVAAAGSGSTGITTSLAFSNPNALPVGVTSFSVSTNNYGQFGPITIPVGATLVVQGGSYYTVI
jgi:hypothetical protein